MTSDFTATDLFCGAGGSSTGMAAAGARVVYAANHWPLAIETHATNHPDTLHDCADLRAVHPATVPATTMLWSSPECTNHTMAKGRTRKAAAQLDLWGNTGLTPEEIRSRATMREVVEFSAYHRYPLVVVENVVEVRWWEYYDDWLSEMSALGYDYRVLYLNAQFFGVPQSRDRVYIVFWHRGNRAPDLEFRPSAVCPVHGRVEAVQHFKQPIFTWGRYRAQYLYRCPTCRAVVEPETVAASTVIDWSRPLLRIDERPRGLAANTLRRVEVGLKRYGPSPFLVSYYGRDDAHSPASAPLPTIPTENRHWLCMPRDKALVMAYYGSNSTYAPAGRPMPTVTTVQKHALIEMAASVGECGFRMLQPEELKLGMDFPSEYIILGNQRQQVKQIGNAVCAGVAEWITRRCMETLK